MRCQDLLAILDLPAPERQPYQRSPEAVHRTNERIARILFARYQYGLAVAVVARAEGVSRERIRQIVAKGLRLLTSPHRAPSLSRLMPEDHPLRRAVAAWQAKRDEKRAQWQEAEARRRAAYVAWRNDDERATGLAPLRDVDDISRAFTVEEF